MKLDELAGIMRDYGGFNEKRYEAASSGLSRERASYMLNCKDSNMLSFLSVNFSAALEGIDIHLVSGRDFSYLTGDGGVLCDLGEQIADQFVLDGESYVSYSSMINKSLFTCDFEEGVEVDENRLRRALDSVVEAQNRFGRVASVVERAVERFKKNSWRFWVVDRIL